jgi:hypothetical protein
MALSKEQNRIIKELIEQVEFQTSNLDDEEKLEALEEFHDKMETIIDDLRNEIEDEENEDEDEDDYEDSELEDEDEDEDEDE